MILVLYTGKPLPDTNGNGIRHTVQKSDGLFGDLVMGYVYARSIEAVVEWVKTNEPEARMVSNKTEVRYISRR